MESCLIPAGLQRQGCVGPPPGEGEPPVLHHRMEVIQPEELPHHLILLLPSRGQVLERRHVEGHHVLEDPAADLLRPVRHGAVLDGAGEHDDVTRLGGELDSPAVELRLVLRVAGVEVGAGDDGGGTVLRVEVGEEGDHLQFAAVKIHFLNKKKTKLNFKLRCFNYNCKIVGF